MIEIVDNDFHIICIDNNLEKNVKSEDPNLGCGKYNIGNKLLINKEKIIFVYLYYSQIEIINENIVSPLILRIIMENNKEIIIFPDTYYVLIRETILSDSDLLEILIKNFKITEKNIRERYRSNIKQFVESVRINIYRYNDKIKEIYEILRDN